MRNSAPAGVARTGMGGINTINNYPVIIINYVNRNA